MAALQEFFLVWFPLVVQSGMHLVFISCLAGKRLKLGYCGGYLLLACTMQSYLLSIAGMLLALFQRIREIGKGEIDDAKKY